MLRWNFYLSKSYNMPAGGSGFVSVTKPDRRTGSNKIVFGLWELPRFKWLPSPLESDNSVFRDVPKCINAADVLCDGLNAMENR